MVSKEVLIEAFIKRAGYVPNVDKPETFNEKILHRKLYDHDPWFGTLVDKIESKKVAKELAGIDSAKVLWEGKDVSGMPIQAPSIIKMNAASGRQWKVLRELNRKEKEVVRHKAASSLLSTYAANKSEWAYGIIPKKVFVEEWLGKVKDVKFFVFHGEVKVVVEMSYGTGREKIDSLSMFRPDGSKVKASMEPFPDRQMEISLDKETLKEGIKIAEALGKSCDFVRCDVYYREEDRKWFFGEFTIYPTSGMAKYKPRSFDKELGSYWRLT